MANSTLQLIPGTVSTGCEKQPTYLYRPYKYSVIFPNTLSNNVGGPSVCAGKGRQKKTAISAKKLQRASWRTPRGAHFLFIPRHPTFQQKTQNSQSVFAEPSALLYRGASFTIIKFVCLVGRCHVG